MKVIFEPSRAMGIVKAPPSKSLSHRAILSALLSHGTSRIENIVLSDDLKAMLEAAEKLGAAVKGYPRTRLKGQGLSIIL